MSKIRYSSKITKFDLFKLSIPIFFSNLAIPFVGIVDTALMGHLDGEKYLVSISIATSVISMIFWSFGFLRMGTTGMVAQANGKGDYREIVLILIRNLCIAGFISLVIIILQHPLLYFIDYLFNTSEQTSLLIKKYISIRVFSAPAELTLYILVGFYLGLQKTKTSSLMISIFSISNILISAYLVVYLDLNISGVALGTLLSAYLVTATFLIYTYFLIINKFKIIPRFKKIFIRNKLIKLFSINLNIFIRTALLTFSFFWFTYQGSKLGEDYVAVNTILLQFIILSSFFLDSYAYSTEGLIGYSIGRENQKLFLSAVRNSFELSFLTSLFISIIYFLFFKSLINILTDIEMIRFLSYGFIFWIILIPPISSFCYQFDGIFIGATNTAEMRNAMIISFTLFIFSSKYLALLLGNHGLWLSLLLFMIFRSITLRIYFFKILKKF